MEFGELLDEAMWYCYFWHLSCYMFNEGILTVIAFVAEIHCNDTEGKQQTLPWEVRTTRILLHGGKNLCSCTGPAGVSTVYGTGQDCYEQITTYPISIRSFQIAPELWPSWDSVGLRSWGSRITVIYTSWKDGLCPWEQRALLDLLNLASFQELSNSSVSA